MNEFRKFIPTIIRASIYRVVFGIFSGKKGLIALVVLLALYFINSEFNWINI